MRTYRALIMFCVCPGLCCAQTAKTDQALLSEARAKYDAPFNGNLQSFDCAVDFSWKQHFTETTRVGDEGTDEELEKIFQPIKNRVTVTRQDVTVLPGMTEEAISKLPHGGMAEGLLEHAVRKSLETWLPASTNTILPPTGAPISFEKSQSGYKVAFKMQGSDIEMTLDPEMRLQSAGTKEPRSDHFETTFVAGDHGFLLSSMTLEEDGNAEPGHRLIFTYSYQTVDGMQLPEQVSITRESHHEVWRYKLSGCVVKTTK